MPLSSREGLDSHLVAATDEITGRRWPRVEEIKGWLIRRLRQAAPAAVVATALAGPAMAAPAVRLENNDSNGFGVNWVKHEPGSKNVDVYGASSRIDINTPRVDPTNMSWDSCRLRANDNGVSNNWAFQWMKGIGDTKAYDEDGVSICPTGSFCAGKVFDVNDDTGAITYCDIAGDGLTASNCATIPTAFKAAGAISFSNNKLLVANQTNGLLNEVDHLTGVAMAKPNCNGGGGYSAPAGQIVNGFLYLDSNRSGSLGLFDLWRITWNGTDCTGAANNLNKISGYSPDPINSANDESGGAIDPLTGDIYFTDYNGYGLRKKLTPTCGDGFVSGQGEVGGEQCDPAASAFYKLNGQDCTTLGMGFIGGSLGCNAVTCQFDTSACTGVAVCGNGVKEGNEQCDKGAGNTDVPPVAAYGKTVDYCDSGCVAHTVVGPYCGDGVCEGADGETNATCASDCKEIADAGAADSGDAGAEDAGAPDAGVICGDGVVEGQEVCDTNNFKGKTCETEKGVGYTGNLDCANSCSTIDSSACVVAGVDGGAGGGVGGGDAGTGGAGGMGGFGGNGGGTPDAGPKCTAEVTSGKCTAECDDVGATTVHLVKGDTCKVAMVADKACTVEATALFDDNRQFTLGIGRNLNFDEGIQRRVENHKHACFDFAITKGVNMGFDGTVAEVDYKDPAHQQMATYACIESQIHLTDVATGKPIPVNSDPKSVCLNNKPCKANEIPAGYSFVVDEDNPLGDVELPDAGQDSGSVDAGLDAGSDGGQIVDAGKPVKDAGVDTVSPAPETPAKGCGACSTPGNSDTPGGLGLSVAAAIALAMAGRRRKELGV